MSSTINLLIMSLYIFNLLSRFSNLFLTGLISFILFYTNLVYAYETTFLCTGKKNIKIVDLVITISGTEQEVVEKNEVPAQAQFSLAKFGKNSEKKIKLVGSASNSAKGIYYELRPAPGQKSKITEMFISAPASQSESTFTDVTEKEYSMDCK